MKSNNASGKKGSHINRSEIIGDLAAEIVRVLPDDEKELDADDIDAIEQTVSKVLEDATDAIDESDDEEDTKVPA
jgi:hypothetical protein